jgi:TPR repeat protein
MNPVHVLVPVLLASCAGSPAPPCPAPPIEVAAAPAPQPEPDLRAGLTDEQRAAQRIAKACVRGEVKACQSIAENRVAKEPDTLPALIAVAQAEVSKEAARRDQEAALGQKLLEAPGPERLTAPDHLEVACELAHAGACNDLGWAWANGFGTLRKDETRAAELYELACDLGNNLGCLNRGRLARNSDKGKAARYMALGCEKKLEKACVELAGTVAEAETACKKDAAACSNWGYIQEHGYGTPADDKQAFAKFEQACTAKNAVGCFNAGNFLRDGRVGKADRAGAKRRFDASCKAGHDAGCRQAALLKP